MNKIFTVAHIKDLLNQVNKEEISFSRLVEILNETANKQSNVQHTIPKRMFQILDEMNLNDVEDGGSRVALSNTFLSAEKVKQGGKITMGVDDSCIQGIMTSDSIPILLVVNKDDYFKRKQ